MIARVLESVAIVVTFSGKPLGTVCRGMQKLFMLLCKTEVANIYLSIIKWVLIFAGMLGAGKNDAIGTSLWTGLSLSAEHEND